MAEAKKRFRPTLTAYRALESENSELKEEIARLRQYREDLVPLDKHNDLMAKSHALEQSNTLMEQELDRVRKANLELGTLSSQLSNELREIKSRGFWKRVFNCV